jgi:hypothetical protein
MSPARISAIFSAVSGSTTCASTRPAVESKNAIAFGRRPAVFSYLGSEDTRYSPVSSLTTFDTANRAQKTFRVCSFLPNASRSEELRKAQFEEERNPKGFFETASVSAFMAYRMSFGRKTKNSDEFFSCLRSDDFRQVEDLMVFSSLRSDDLRQDKEQQEQDCRADERERQCGDAGEPEAGRDRDVRREQGCHAGLAEAEPGPVLGRVLCLLNIRQLRRIEHADRVEHAPAEGAERVGEGCFPS